MTAVWHPPTPTAGRRAAVITPRQADVLTAICHGLTSARIAARLDISEDTVKTHLRHLYRALGARDRAHAVALAASGHTTVVVRDPSERSAP